MLLFNYIYIHIHIYAITYTHTHARGGEGRMPECPSTQVLSELVSGT